MTCAHLKYPLGTMLKVKNVQNGKEVVVEVTDRGPHIKKYMIDLSYAAARELGFTQSGFCLVEVTPCYIDQVPYRGGKTEYELPRPEYDTLRPIRTWNHPVWEKTHEGTKVRGEDLPTDDNQR